MDSWNAMEAIGSFAFKSTTKTVFPRQSGTEHPEGIHLFEEQKGMDGFG
nr:hypothetical protein [uncultured Pedobacter sp.]